MTLLSICQDASDEIGVLRPSSIYGSTSEDARKLYRYANKVGRRLMKAFPWQVLRKEQTFTATAGSTQTGILPSDFDRMVAETFWDRSGSRLITGPVSPVEWQSLKTFGFSGTEARFAYRGGDILVLPVMAGGESLAFEYVSNKWCQSSGGTAQVAWGADTDTGILDEELITLGVIYEFLDGDGQPANSAGSQYLERFNTLTGNELPAAKTMLAADIFGGGRRFGGAPYTQSTPGILS